jgi:hypothetical protein
LFISADAAEENEKKEKKVLLPTGISKSEAPTVQTNLKVLLMPECNPKKKTFQNLD